MRPNRKVARQVWELAVSKFGHVPSKFSLGSLLLQLATTPNTSTNASYIDTSTSSAVAKEIEDTSTAGPAPLGLNDKASAELGLKLLDEAAQEGHAWAASNLALVMSRGIPSIDLRANVAKAVEMYQKAWSLGKVPYAPYNIFVLLQPSNQALAFKWLRVSADEANDSSAQYQLACMIRDGKIPPEVRRKHPPFSPLHEALIII